jgi:hypothetical protein
MLNTDFNLDNADDFYEALIDAHRDLSTAQSHALNAGWCCCWPITSVRCRHCARHWPRRGRTSLGRATAR